MRADLTPGRILAARAVAVGADLLQLGLLPAVPLVEALDVAVAVILIGLLGWHWVFLPSMVIEAIPWVGAVPTWTASVLYATRNVPVAPADLPPEERDAGSGSTKPAG
jgi:hypothetical protein